MKKAFVLIFCFILFLFSWKSYQNKIHESEEQSLSKQNTVQKKVHKKKKAKQVKIPSIKKPLSLKKVKAQKPKTVTKGSFQKEFDEKKMAIGDEKGNLYPTSLGVDGQHIIGFGDLIVGNAKDIEAIKNGDKIVSIPYPKLWPGGVIPIQVSPEIKKSRQYQWIQEIMKELKQNANITIRLSNINDNARVQITRGKEHCYAQVGYTGEPTQMSLSENCSKIAIYHEFFHVLGFFHEQNRFDREDYLEILWENIDEQYWPQFKLFPENSFQRIFTSGGPFQFTFNTIMIYDSTFFSLNQDYSMVRTDGTPFSSTFTAPTEIDIARLKELYQSQSRD
jgi:hypothetical protein